MPQESYDLIMKGSKLISVFGDLCSLVNSIVQKSELGKTIGLQSEQSLGLNVAKITMLKLEGG